MSMFLGAILVMASNELSLIYSRYCIGFQACYLLVIYVRRRRRFSVLHAMHDGRQYKRPTTNIMAS